ncbi:MAG: tRNA pseudouridine(13) synthase TruD [Candidatus Methanomethylicia archaeon]
MFYETKSGREKLIGLKYYSTPNDISISDFNIENIEDFIVQEVLRGWLTLPINEKHGVFLPVSCRGNYVRAILVKKGIDTLTAIHTISKIVNIPLDEIQFLGLKDAKGITSQLISLKYTKKLGKLKTSNINIVCSYESCAPVSTQELWGNKFTITLRKRKKEGENDENFLKNMIKLQKLISTNALISYFGYQRFGILPPLNHIIGKYILKREYHDAIKIILSDKNISNVNNDYRLIYEKEIIDLMNKFKKDYLCVFKNIPKIIVKIFLQSYQSFLFNKMINKRIELGLPLDQAVIGDIVGYSEATIYRDDDIIVVTNSNFDKINRLVKQGQLSILYPLLGYLTEKRKMPSGEAYEPIAKVIEEEEICPDDFLFNDIPEISLAGYYRPLTFRVYNFLWHLTKSSDIKCSFFLKRGFYATIVLRELIKPA